jgi:hypothetical protein
MGLSWQHGALSPGAIDRFLIPELLPRRLIYAEPRRRRMRVRFGGTWIQLDGAELHPEPNQSVIRELTVAEARPRGEQHR